MTLDGWLALSLLIPAALVLQTPRRPERLLVAYLSVTAFMLASEASLNPLLQTVLLRDGGGDFLAYESYARSILDTGSFQGGEAVFYYQPLFRYLRFAEHLVLGDGDILIAVLARTLLIASILWMTWTFRRINRWSGAIAAVGLVLLLGLANSSTLVTLIRNGVTEYPTWIAFPLFFTLFFRQTRRSAFIGVLLLGGSLITRTNQAPGLLWLFGIRAWRAVRSRDRRVALAAVALIIVCLLPAAHNLYYGDKVVLLSTSAAIPENLVLRPVTYWEARHDEDAKDRVLEHLDLLLYGPAAHKRPVPAGGGLAPVFRGLQALWLLAVVLMLRHAWVSGTLRHLPVAVAPAFFLGTHLFYQVDVYYPRHIVVGHLAMAAVALYASAHTRAQTSGPAPSIPSRG